MTTIKTNFDYAMLDTNYDYPRAEFYNTDDNSKIMKLVLHVNKSEDEEVLLVKKYNGVNFTPNQVSEIILDVLQYMNDDYGVLNHDEECMISSIVKYYKHDKFTVTRFRYDKNREHPEEVLAITTYLDGRLQTSIRLPIKKLFESRSILYNRLVPGKEYTSEELGWYK